MIDLVTKEIFNVHKDVLNLQNLREGRYLKLEAQNIDNFSPTVCEDTFETWIQSKTFQTVKSVLPQYYVH